MQEQTQPIILATSKSWYVSKTVWFNLILTLLNAAALAQMIVGTLQQQKPELDLTVALAVLTFIQGLGNIILRIWFTTQPIKAV